jgi:hypothetical protein
MSTDPTQQIEYDPATLHGLTDHMLLQTTVKLPKLQTLATRTASNKQPEILYKWIEGTCISNYSQSAKKWEDWTSKTEFTEKFQTLVENKTMGNEERAAAIEKWIL